MDNVDFIAFKNIKVLNTYNIKYNITSFQSCMYDVRYLYLFHSIKRTCIACFATHFPDCAVQYCLTFAGTRDIACALLAVDIFPNKDQLFVRESYCTMSSKTFSPSKPPKDKFRINMSGNIQVWRHQEVPATSLGKYDT